MMMSSANLIVVVVLLSGVVLSLTEGKPREEKDYGLAVGGGGDYQYDESDDDYYDAEGDEYRDDSNLEKAIDDDPKFVSKGKTFTVDKGTTIRLPCYVDKFPVRFVIMWKKVENDQREDNYLVIGNNVIDKTETHRISVELNHDGNETSTDKRGSTLVIPLATDADAGQYVCIIAGNNAKELKHTVAVRVPPSIMKEPSNGLLRASKGESVVMACHGEGNPKPKIKWSRKGKMMPDGRDFIEASELRFSNVNRKHSGTYICTADNGFGQVAKQQIHLEVEYPAEVEVEEIFVHAATGNSVELVCLIHAHPVATVKWYKDRIELSPDKQKLEQIGHHRYTLTIPEVTRSDYGNYTCRAENPLGHGEGSIEISGKAGFANFKSEPKGGEPNTYLLEWTSESHTPITAFEMRHRDHGESSWHSVEVKPFYLNSFSYAGKHAISGLRGEGRFEATVAAKNEDGWSRHSPVFHFSTFDAEPLTGTNSSTTAYNSGSPMATVIALVFFSSRWFLFGSY